MKIFTILETAAIIHNIRKEKLYRTSIEHYAGFFFSFFFFKEHQKTDDYADAELSYHH